MIPLASAQFACTGCGSCCRNHAKGEPRWPAFFEALATRGLYALPMRDGLGMTSEERRVYEARARERGLTVQMRPALAALDTTSDRLIVFAWETDTEACVFIGDDERCAIYADRPLACRAFPLRYRQGTFAASPLCGAAVTPPDGDYARAYPDVLPYAAEARALVANTLARVRALQAEGRLVPVVGASRNWVARLMAGGAWVDVLDAYV